MAGLELDRSSVAFDLVGPDGSPPSTSRCPVPGLHNARNAAVAAVAALAAGAPPSAAAAALARFGGVARRFEFRGAAGGVTFVDDYGHLPGEVRAALAAARHGGWRRVVAVFQPHRYTRTAELGRDFGPAFADADVVVVTDVYPAGEAPDPRCVGQGGGRGGAGARSPTCRCTTCPAPRRARAVRWPACSEPGDLCLTLGAGDLTAMPDELLAELER